MSCPRRFVFAAVAVLVCSSAVCAWDCPAMEFSTKLIPSSHSSNMFDMMLTPLNVRHSDIQRTLDEVTMNLGDKKISLLGMGDMSAANGTQSFKTTESFNWLPENALSYSFTYKLGDLTCTSNLETLKAKVEHEAPKEVIVKVTTPAAPYIPTPPKMGVGPTPAAGLCPVIRYDHGVTPCEDLYAISFVNKDIDKPLHWIDIHYSINDSPMSNHRMLQHSGPISTHSAEDEALGSAIVAKRGQEKLMRERAAALAASGATEMEVNAFSMQMQNGQMQMGDDATGWGMQQGASAAGLQQQMGSGKTGFGMQQQASVSGQQQQLHAGSGVAGSVGGGMQQQQGGSSSADAKVGGGQQQQMSGGSAVTAAAGSTGGLQQQQGGSSAVGANAGFGQQQQIGSSVTGVGGGMQQQQGGGAGVGGAAGGFGQQQQIGGSATGVGGMQQQQGHGVGGAAGSGFGQQQQLGGTGVGGMQQQQGHGASGFGQQQQMGGAATGVGGMQQQQGGGLGQQQQIGPATVKPTVIPVTPIAPAIDVPKIDQPKVALVPAVTKSHAPLPTHEVETPTPTIKVSVSPAAPAAPAADFGHPALSPISPLCIIPTSCQNCQIFTHKGLLLTPGDKVTYWFTYCQDGVDCDTEKHEFIVPGAPAKQFAAPRGRECIAWRDL